MDPEVPQALRLQAILASGIVKLHEKKVDYLKEDAEHAMVSIWSSTSSISSRCSNLHTYIHYTCRRDYAIPIPGANDQLIWWKRDRGKSELLQ